MPGEGHEILAEDLERSLAAIGLKATARAQGGRGIVVAMTWPHARTLRDLVDRVWDDTHGRADAHQL